MRRELLFAYGTLLTGTPDSTLNALLRTELRPLCRGYIAGHLHELGGYPGAVQARSLSGWVYGQLLAVRRAREVLESLDRFEGYHGHAPERSYFVRRRTRVIALPSRRTLEAWVYYYNQDPVFAPRIRGGDYHAWLQRRGRIHRRLPAPLLRGPGLVAARKDYTASGRVPVGACRDRRDN